MGESGDTNSRAVLVLGMHRSGTSALTAALGVLGVGLGEHLMPGQADNPKGFFEDLDLAAVNIELLTELGSRWDRLCAPAWSALPAERRMAWVRKTAGIIRERFEGLPLWGFKDPRVIRLLPFWREVLAAAAVKPLFVVANRHPLSVAASLARRDQMSPVQALMLWILHQAAALQALVNEGGLVVDYDELIENPRRQLDRLQQFLGAAAPVDDVPLQSFVTEFLERGLRHARHDLAGRDLANGKLAEACRYLYVHLRAWALLADAAPANLLAEGRALASQLLDYFDSLQDLMTLVDAKSATIAELEWWREKLWLERCQCEDRDRESAEEITILRARLKETESRWLHAAVHRWEAADRRR